MRWEHQTLDIPRSVVSGRTDKDALRALLDQEGQKGWELVSILENPASGLLPAPSIAVFKRPLPAS